MSGYFPSVNERDLTRIVQAIRDLSQGRSNAVGTFTLAAGGTSTVVTAANCGEDSVIVWMPMTATAAAAMTSLRIASGDVERGQFTLTHNNTADVDRTFKYQIQG